MTTTKTALIGVACFAIGIIVAYGLFFKSGPDTDIGDPPKEDPIVEEKPMEKISKKSISTSAVDRVISRTMRGEFQLKGRGEDANWGLSREANFVCTEIVVADSKIIENKTMPDGEIKVTEIRTFNTVQDSIVVSDVDVKLALDTLPIKAFSAMIDAAAIVYTSMTGDTETAANVLESKDYVMEALRDVDGTSAKNLLGAVGIELPEIIQTNVDKLVNTNIRKALGGIRAISGKSYKITYTQEKDGTPLYVKITYSNGDEVYDEEEQMVLKRVNAFIDYDLVPNKDCEPGDKWTVEANNIQELFDPYAEGRYSGTIGVERTANTPDGDWNIKLNPSVINVINANNNTTGFYNLQHGYAIVDSDLASVRELFGAGTAKIQKVSKHHWLFTAKISGECEFQGKLVSTPKENKD